MSVQQEIQTLRTLKQHVQQLRAKWQDLERVLEQTPASHYAKRQLLQDEQQALIHQIDELATHLKDETHPLFADSITWGTIDCFWSQVQKTDACWLWKGETTKQGYGVFKRHDVPFLAQAAYRFAFMLTNGLIPPGMGLVVRHRCAVRACVNPAHLLLGEHWENALDRVIRQRRGIVLGMVFTYEDDPDTTLLILNEHLWRKSGTTRQQIEARIKAITLLSNNGF